MASISQTSATLSTLSRGTGFAERNGPKVRLQPTEMTLITGALERKASIRRSRDKRRRAAIPKTYSTRRGMMLLYPNSFLQKKALGEGNSELGDLEASILTDSKLFSDEFEKWATAVLGDDTLSSSGDDEDMDILTDIAGNKQSDLLPALMTFPSNARKTKRIRPGLSARRYLINLAEGAESKLNCNWKGKGYVADSTFFEANAANPELKRKVKADLTELPEPYSLSHFLTSTLPLHVYACDYSLPLLDEVEDYDMFPADEKDAKKKDDQESGKLKGKQKNESDSLPQIKKPTDYAKLPLDAKRALLADRLIQAAISMAIRKHKELFESFLKSQAVVEDNNKSNRRVSKEDAADITGELRSAPWLNFNDALKAIGYDQKYVREKAKAKLRGRQSTSYDGNPDIYTAPFSTYVRPRLLGGTKLTVSFRDVEKAQVPIERPVAVPPRTDLLSGGGSDMNDDDELVAPELINYEPVTTKPDTVLNEQTNSNLSSEGGSVLGRLFAEGSSPEMKRILQSIPLEIFEAVEDDLIHNLANHANRIAKQVLARPGNGKILDKDAKLALDMWTKFLLEPISQPPTFSSKKTTPSLTRGESHSFAPSSSPRFSGGSGAARTLSSTNFEQKSQIHEDGYSRSPINKVPPKQHHIQAFDFSSSDSLPQMQSKGPTTDITSPNSTSRTVVTKEFKGAFDMPEKQEIHQPESHAVIAKQVSRGAPKSKEQDGQSPQKASRQHRKEPSETSFHVQEKAGPNVAVGDAKVSTPAKIPLVGELPSLTGEISAEQNQQALDSKPQQAQQHATPAARIRAPPATPISVPDSSRRQTQVQGTPIEPPTAGTIPTVPQKLDALPSSTGPLLPQGAIPANQALAGSTTKSEEAAPRTVGPVSSIPAKFAGPSPAIQTTAGLSQPQGAIPSIPAKFTGPPPANQGAPGATTQPQEAAPTAGAISSIPAKFAGPSPAVQTTAGPSKPPQGSIPSIPAKFTGPSPANQAAAEPTAQALEATATAGTLPPIPAKFTGTQPPGVVPAGGPILSIPAKFVGSGPARPVLVAVASDSQQPQLIAPQVQESEPNVITGPDVNKPVPEEEESDSDDDDEESEDEDEDATSPPADEQKAEEPVQLAEPQLGPAQNVDSILGPNISATIERGKASEPGGSRLAAQPPVAKQKLTKSVSRKAEGDEVGTSGKTDKAKIKEPVKRVDSKAPAAKQEEGGATEAAPNSKTVRQSVVRTDSNKPAISERRSSKVVSSSNDFDIVLPPVLEENVPTGDGQPKQKGKKEKKPKKEKEKPFITGPVPLEKAEYLPAGDGAVKKKKGKKKKKGTQEQESIPEASDYSHLLGEEQQAPAEEGGSDASEGHLAPLEGAVNVQVNFKRERKHQAPGLLRKKPSQLTLSIPDDTEEGRLSKVTEGTDDGQKATPITASSSPSRRRSTMLSEQSEPDFNFIPRSPTEPTIKSLSPPSNVEEAPPEVLDEKKSAGESSQVTASESERIPTAAEMVEPNAIALSREEMIKRKKEAVEARRRERKQQQEEELRLAEEEASKKEEIQHEIEAEAKAIEDAARAEFDRRLDEKILQEQEEEERAIEAERVEQFETFVAEQEKARLEDFKTKFQEELKRRRTSRALRRLESKAVSEGMETFGLWLTDEAVMSEICPPIEGAEVAEQGDAEGDDAGAGAGTKGRLSMHAHKIVMEARRKAMEAERRALLQGYQRLTASALQRRKLVAKRLEHWGMLYHSFRLTRAFVWSYFSLLQWLRFDKDDEKLPSIDEF